MAKKLTKKDLVVAYKELDKVIGIEPPIEYEDLKQDEFEEELYKTYVDLVEEGDKFSKATQAVFDALTEKYGTEDEEEEDEEEEDEDEEEEDEDEEEEDEDEEEEDEEEEKPAPPVKKGKKPEPEPEDEDEEEEEEDEKPVKKGKEKPEKKEKTKKQPPKKQESGESQTDVIRAAIRKKMKREKIVELLKEKFAQSEGWANNRMKMYEKAYGEMGVKDKNLQ